MFCCLQLSWVDYGLSYGVLTQLNIQQQLSQLTTNKVSQQFAMELAETTQIIRAS